MSLFKLLDYSLCPMTSLISIFQNEWIFCIFWNFSLLPSKCHSSNQEKFLKRNYSRTAVIFQALKMKCSLVICRSAIKQEMSLFQTFGLPLFVSHRVSWTGLASSNDTTKKTFANTDIDCSMLVEEHQHL